MMKKKFQDQKIGQVGNYYQKKWSFGIELKIEFMKDLNIQRKSMENGKSFY